MSITQSEQSSKNNVIKTIVEKEVEGEIIWITMAKYALFMSYGKIGIDAKSLYEHYQFTAILQKTNSVKAVDRYCRQGLGWGRDRMEKAKNLLLDLDLIEIKKVRNEKGQFNTNYVKVRTKQVALEPSDIENVSENQVSENPQSGKTTVGKTAPNALTNNLNALTNNLNATPQNAFNQWWKLYDKKINHKKAKKKFDKLSKDTIPLILDHTAQYVESTPDIQYRKDPFTYLDNECWNDQIIFKQKEQTFREKNAFYDSLPPGELKKIIGDAHNKPQLGVYEIIG